MGETTVNKRYWIVPQEVPVVYRIPGACAAPLQLQPVRPPLANLLQLRLITAPPILVGPTCDNMLARELTCTSKAVIVVCSQTTSEVMSTQLFQGYDEVLHQILKQILIMTHRL